mgnify:CR=1 FL=1
MYKAAEQEINKGLSPFARSVIAVFSALFGLIMIFTAPPTEKAIYFFAFGVFCFLVTFASVTKGKARQFVGRIIGCVLFALSVWYMYTQLTTGPGISGSRSQPSIVNSISFFIAFGIPGIGYAIRTKFGKKSANNNQDP